MLFISVFEMVEKKNRDNKNQCVSVTLESALPLPVKQSQSFVSSDPYFHRLNSSDIYQPIVKPLETWLLDAVVDDAIIFEEPTGTLRPP